jgi:hypothetical protein
MPNPLTRVEALRRIAFTVWAAIGVIALIWIFLVVADSVRIIWLPLAFGGGLTCC